MSIHDQLLHLMRDVTASDDRVLHLGRLGCEVSSDVLALKCLRNGLGGSLLTLGTTELGLHVGTLQSLRGSKLTGLGRLACVALHAALLVRELGGLLHGDLLGLLHHGLLVGVMVLAGVVKRGVDELEHTVSAMESLTAPVVQLVLTDEACAIGLEAVAGDNALLSHLHAENCVGIVHGILGAKEGMLGSNAGLGSKSGSEGRAGVLDHLASILGGLACLLDGTIVRLELASRTKLVLLGNHLLVLGGRGDSDHGLHSTLTLATHENTLLAVTDLPGGNLAQRLGITLEGMIGPLLSGIQIAVSPSNGTCVVGIGNTSISQRSLHRSLGSHLLLLPMSMAERLLGNLQRFVDAAAQSVLALHILVSLLLASLVGLLGSLLHGMRGGVGVSAVEHSLPRLLHGIITILHADDQHDCYKRDRRC